MKTIKQIQDVMLKKGYSFFQTGTYNLNLIGIRSLNSQSDSFDDDFYVIYKDDTGNWKMECFKCTTDPGKHWLQAPMNSTGTIIMVPGQYPGAYAIGTHTGYEALRQVKPIAYVRDNNKDTKLDFSLYKDPKNIFKDICATNIHRASQWKKLLSVGMYSAGCQVIQDPADFAKLLKLAHLQVSNGQGKTFTYTLLEETDFVS